VEIRHSSGLDVLRGVAILLVVPLSHFLPVGHSIAFDLGILGVVLFFFLSGFLMGQTFASEPQLGPYAIRRAFRILPMYWITIALIYFLERTWTVADVGANATFTAPIFGLMRMSGIYWTLYIEVLFYALIPILLFSDWRIALLSPYGVIAAYAAAAAARAHVGPAAFFLVFCLLGMQFSFWTRKQLSGWVLVVNLAAATVASAALPVLSPLLGAAPLICGLLMLWAIRCPIRQQLLEFFGRVSYSWYLLHPIVGMPIIVLAGVNTWRGAVAADFVSLAAASATYFFIERPTQRLGRMLATSIRSRRSVIA
jgi:peptidoglycan/LPS O-acetylase OafA/YrhL